MSSKFTIKDDERGTIKIVNLITNMVAWSGSYIKGNYMDTFNTRVKAREIKDTLDKNVK